MVLFQFAAVESCSFVGLSSVTWYKFQLTACFSQLVWYRVSFLLQLSVNCMYSYNWLGTVFQCLFFIQVSVNCFHTISYKRNSINLLTWGSPQVGHATIAEQGAKDKRKRNPTNSRQNDHKKNDSYIIHIGLGNKQNECTNHEFKNKICKNFVMIGRNPARTIRPGPTPTSASSLRCRCCRSTFLNPTNDLSHFAEMPIAPPL